MVAVKDFYWEKRSGKWRMKMCPMGEGMVDWGKFFAMLSQARFTGPISIHQEYEPADRLSALARDLEFVKKQLAVAYSSRS
jgi:sugar phosphate isomerase/epimerase